MTKYILLMVDDLSPAKLEGKGTFPWTNKLFTVDPKSSKLDDKRAKIFHTFVVKGVFLCKRAWQDIQPSIAFLATRTTDPTENDWLKLIKILVFLKATLNQVATMKADDTKAIKWYVDATFAVHKDYKSHTGATMTLGDGVLCSVLTTKQKAMSQRSTGRNQSEWMMFSPKSYGRSYLSRRRATRLVQQSSTETTQAQ
jgi:hypothetical protein